AAVREGKAFGVTWEDSGSSGWHLVRTWEKAFEERLTEVRLAGGRMVVRFEGGSLMGIDASARELWRLRLSAGDRFELLPQAASLVIMSASELRLYDWASGHQTFQWNVQSPAVSADVRGRSLVWVDRAGDAHQVDVQDGRLVATTVLGVPLAAAASTPNGFLVTTASGEAGFVEGAIDGGERRGGMRPLRGVGLARSSRGGSGGGGRGAAYPGKGHLRGRSRHRGPRRSRGGHRELHQPRGIARGIGRERPDRRAGEVPLRRAAARQVHGGGRLSRIRHRERDGRP